MEPKFRYLRYDEWVTVDYANPINDNEYNAECDDKEREVIMTIPNPTTSLPITISIDGGPNRVWLPDAP